MRKLCVVLMTACLSTLSAVTLEYKFEKNKPLNYELKMQWSSSFVSPDNGERNLKMDTHVLMKQELIEQEADGELKIAMTILRASQTVNGIEKPFPAGTEQTQIVRMKKNGSILSTLVQVPGQSPDQNALQMVFPDKEVIAGDTWTRIREIANPVPVETKTLYKITELGPQNATISSVMKLKNTTGDSVTASTKGSTLFDHAAGKIVTSSADSDFQFEIPMKVPGLLPGSSNVKVTLKIQINVKELSDAELKKILAVAVKESAPVQEATTAAPAPEKKP